MLLKYTQNNDFLAQHQGGERRGNLSFYKLFPSISINSVVSYSKILQILHNTSDKNLVWSATVYWVRVELGSRSWN